MKTHARHHNAVSFLSALDSDWLGLINLVGPCTLEVEASREPYEALISAVAHQQLHARASEAILGRLFALDSQGGYPPPRALLALSDEALRSCGFSTRKVESLRAIADATFAGTVPTRAQALELDNAELIARLVTLRGVGRWTVEMLLIFTLGREDVLPVDDFGVREGYRALKSLPEAPRPRELARIGEAWQPYRSIAAWYLWRMPR